MDTVSEPQSQFCSECGQPRPSSDLVRFGDRLVCPDCKNSYAQKLREGVAPVAVVAYGGFWLRFVAILIDSIILYVIETIINFAVLGSAAPQMAGTNPAANPADIGAALSKVGVAWLIGMAVGVTYETFFIGKMGATPGKMALGLKVVRADGSPVDYGRAAGRYFAKILSAIILCIGYIMAGFDSQKRALHDMICDTRVIKSRG